MTALWIVFALLGVAVWRGFVWLRQAGDRSWAAHQAAQRRRQVRLDLGIDTSQMQAALRRAAESVGRMARRMGPFRPCGCLEMAEHTRDCRDHPLNAGIRSALRWRSREYARRWHAWRAGRLAYAADRHEVAAYGGRWRR